MTRSSFQQGDGREVPDRPRLDTGAAAVSNNVSTGRLGYSPAAATCAIGTRLGRLILRWYTAVGVWGVVLVRLG